MTKIIHKTVWLALPFYMTAGFTYPETGIAALACMIAPVATAFFTGRKWCGTYCPRGSFLDFFLKGMKNTFPGVRFFKNKTVRWSFFVLMMCVFGLQLSHAFITGESAGIVFLRIVTITSILALVLGKLFGRRTWCSICPMGTLAGLAAQKRTRRNDPLEVLPVRE